MERRILPYISIGSSITWVGNLSLEAGYPLVDHAFGHLPRKTGKCTGLEKSMLSE
jgi:hypothetical protein